jgi:hypothetical protein
VQLAIVAILDGVEQAGGLDSYLAQEHTTAAQTFEVPPPRSACG